MDASISAPRLEQCWLVSKYLPIPLYAYSLKHMLAYEAQNSEFTKGREIKSIYPSKPVLPSFYCI